MKMRVYIDACTKSTIGTDLKNDFAFAVESLYLTGNKVKSILVILTKKERKMVKRSFDINISKNKMEKKKVAA